MQQEVKHLRVKLVGCVKLNLCLQYFHLLLVWFEKSCSRIQNEF